MSSLRYATAADLSWFLQTTSKEPLPAAFSFQRAVEALEASDEAVTLWSGTERVALAGYVEPWEHVAEVWALVAEEAGRRNRFLLFRTLRNLLSFAIQDRHWRRVEMSVLADRWDFCKLAERLGFRQYGQRRSYGPQGEDFRLYERLP